MDVRTEDAQANPAWVQAVVGMIDAEFGGDKDADGVYHMRVSFP